MATRSFGTLTLDLVAKTGGFVQGMGKAERAGDNFRRKTQKNMEAVSKAVKTMGLDALGAGSALVRMALATARDIDEMAKTAKRLGVAANEVAGLRLAFELGGSSAEQMEKSLNKLQVEAARGNKVFDRLGISVKKPNGELKNARELLEDVAEKFKDLQNETEKAGVAYDLFGQAGRDIIPVLNDGAAGISNAIAEADAMGYSVLKNAADVEAFRDSMTKLNTKTEALKASFTIGLLPALEGVAEALSESQEGMSTARLIGVELGLVIIDVTKAFVSLYTVLKATGNFWGTALGRFFEHSRISGIVKENTTQLTKNRVEITKINHALERRKGLSEEEQKTFNETNSQLLERKKLLEDENKRLEVIVKLNQKRLDGWDEEKDAVDVYQDAMLSTAKEMQILNRAHERLLSPPKAAEESDKKAKKGLDETKDGAKGAQGAIDGVKGSLKKSGETAAETARRIIKAQDAFKVLTSQLASEDDKRLETLRQQLAVIDEMQAQIDKGIQGAPNQQTVDAARDAAIKGYVKWQEERMAAAKKTAEAQQREAERTAAAAKRAAEAQQRKEKQEAAAQKRRADEQARKIADQIKAAQDAFAALGDDLASDDQRRLGTLKEQLAVIKAMQAQIDNGVKGAASQTDVDNARQAVIGGFATGGLPEYEPENPFSDYDDIRKRLDLLKKAREEDREHKKVYDESIIELDRKKNQALLIGAQTTFGKLADTAKAYAGENSGVYKAMFAMEKAFAIARAVIAIQEGIAKAAANPWPANLAAMASVAAATGSIISAITSVAMPSGMAHEGLDKIPKTGTWLLEKGERVTTANTSAKLDTTLEQIRGNQPPPQKTPQHIRIVNTVDPAMVGSYLGSEDGERLIMNIIGNNPTIVKKVVSA